MIEREVSQQQNIVVIITKEYAKKKKNNNFTKRIQRLTPLNGGLKFLCGLFERIEVIPRLFP